MKICPTLEWKVKENTVTADACSENHNSDYSKLCIPDFSIPNSVFWNSSCICLDLLTFFFLVTEKILEWLDL